MGPLSIQSLYNEQESWRIEQKKPDLWLTVTKTSGLDITSKNWTEETASQPVTAEVAAHCVLSCFAHVKSNQISNLPIKLK